MWDTCGAALTLANRRRRRCRRRLCTAWKKNLNLVYSAN